MRRCAAPLPAPLAPRPQQANLWPSTLATPGCALTPTQTRTLVSNPNTNTNTYPDPSTSTSPNPNPSPSPSPNSNSNSKPSSNSNPNTPTVPDVGLEELLDELTIAPDDEDEHPTTEWGPSPQPGAAAPVAQFKLPEGAEDSFKFT